MENKNNELVVYKNEFNTIPLRNFTAVEMDLLFTIMSQMRDKGITEIEFNFSDLKHLSNYNKETAINSFILDLEKTYDKLLRLNVKIGNSNKFTKFVFFTKYTIDRETKTIVIGVNSEFTPIINELTGNFTKFELEEVTSLNSSYAKSCYRLLKQFRKTGYYKIGIEKFKYLLDVPDSYNMSHLTARVLKPIKKELSKVFKDFKVKKIKSNKDKRKITVLEFTFKPQTDINNKGYATFRDEKTGNYKEKHLYNFNDDDIEKEFPEVPEEIQGQFSIIDHTK